MTGAFGRVRRGVGTRDAIVAVYNKLRQHKRRVKLYTK